MKKLLLLVVVLAFAFGTLYGEVSTDPKKITEDIKLDWHPEYGTVKVGDYPMDSKGWNETKVADLFPGKTVLDYEITEETFSGIALTEHKGDRGETFHVWHQFDNEPVARLKATVQEPGGQVTTYIIIIIIRCSNGMTIIIVIW